MSTPTPPAQPRNPLHGLTLEVIVTALVAHYGWPRGFLPISRMTGDRQKAPPAERIPVRCFSVDPSIGSSLKFLRKTPWAREKVEGLYLHMLREQRRADSGPRG